MILWKKKKYKAHTSNIICITGLGERTEFFFQHNIEAYFPFSFKQNPKYYSWNRCLINLLQMYMAFQFCKTEMFLLLIQEKSYILELEFGFKLNNRMLRYWWALFCCEWSVDQSDWIFKYFDFDWIVFSVRGLLSWSYSDSLEWRHLSKQSSVTKPLTWVNRLTVGISR